MLKLQAIGLTDEPGHAMRIAPNHIAAAPELSRKSAGEKVIGNGDQESANPD
jgi:hypothetical protein